MTATRKAVCDGELPLLAVCRRWPDRLRTTPSGHFTVRDSRLPALPSYLFTHSCKSDDAQPCERHECEQNSRTSEYVTEEKAPYPPQPIGQAPGFGIAYRLKVP
jgi:hypothetical protein